MNFWEALHMFWRMWWKQEPVNTESHTERCLKQLLNDELSGAVKMALEKMKNEPVYPGRPRVWDMADGPTKKREVLAWAYKYYKQMGHADEEISAWHLNFMLEYFVGIEKGRLVDVGVS